MHKTITIQTHQREVLIDITEELKVLDPLKSFYHDPY